MLKKSKHVLFVYYNKREEVICLKETLYTIGEMAKLANVSIKALRYYDKIDLFIKYSFDDLFICVFRHTGRNTSGKNQVISLI